MQTLPVAWWWMFPINWLITQAVLDIYTPARITDTPVHVPTCF